MRDKQVTLINGASLPTLLGIVFIILKLMGYIHWSWLWVLAPLWIPWAIIIFLFLLIGILYVIDEASSK